MEHGQDCGAALFAAWKKAAPRATAAPYKAAKALDKRTAERFHKSRARNGGLKRLEAYCARSPRGQWADCMERECM
eukprot:40642-Pyramimonas_sp.AAC.2